MKILKSRKGKLSSSTVNTAILAIILLVVLFQVYASLVPTAQTAGDSLNASNQCVQAGCVYDGTGASAAACINGSGVGNVSCAQTTTTIPLSGLFSGTGVVFIIIMAALIILVVKSFLKGKK